MANNVNIKIRMLTLFYKSTLLPNIAISVITLALLRDYRISLIVFSAIGVFVSYIFKDQLRKNEYVLYYNLGVSKRLLYSVTVFLNTIISVIIAVIISCIG